MLTYNSVGARESRRHFSKFGAHGSSSSVPATAVCCLTSSAGEPILLDESRLFVKDLEAINTRWRDEGASWQADQHRATNVGLASWDIKAMYPSLKHEYIIRSVDEALVLRISQSQGEDRKRAERLREVVMQLLMFSLQHQFVYVRSEEEGGEEEKSFFWQHQGISIGSSASGAIANLALLGGERKMLHELSGWGGEYQAI